MLDAVSKAGVVSPRKNPETTMKDPVEILRDRSEKRRLVREELRFKELTEKAKKGELSVEEKRELAILKMERFMEEIAKTPTVIYCA